MKTRRFFNENPLEKLRFDNETHLWVFDIWLSFLQSSVDIARSGPLSYGDQEIGISLTT